MNLLQSSACYCEEKLDEVLLCGPDFEMDRVEHIVRESAAYAAELIFGRVPVDFPVSCARVKSYDQAK